MTRLHDLVALGQAPWLDFMHRTLLTSGELQAWIDQGVRGETSNPTIFDQAISGSDAYDASLASLVAQGKSVAEMYEALVLEDIAQAADIMRPLYEQSEGLHGFISLEVSPELAHDTAATVVEAQRLFAALGRPNVMIKVPATPAGIPAIRALTAEGININITLIFSLAQYRATAEAYLAGLEDLDARGGDLWRVRSVASLFVSRLDTLVDARLEKLGRPDLQGKAAVANAKLAYVLFEELFVGARWEKLARAGATVQRPLWASTGTKNPRYSDTLYVDPLIGPYTVSTIPSATLKAFLDHGHVAVTVHDGLPEARALFAELARAGVDLEAATQELQDAGVAAFAKSFEALLASITAKAEKLRR